MNIMIDPFIMHDLIMLRKKNSKRLYQRSLILLKIFNFHYMYQLYFINFFKKTLIPIGIHIFIFVCLSYLLFLIYWFFLIDEIHSNVNMFYQTYATLFEGTGWKIYFFLSMIIYIYVYCLYFGIKNIRLFIKNKHPHQKFNAIGYFTIFFFITIYFLILI